jgi:hypothetical protein
MSDILSKEDNWEVARRSYIHMTSSELETPGPGGPPYESSPSPSFFYTQGLTI